MSISIPTEHVSSFREFQIARGITEPLTPDDKYGNFPGETNFFACEEADLNLFYVSLLNLETPPLVVNPTVEQLRSLGVGAEVVVMAKIVDDLPRVLKLTDVEFDRYKYYSESGIGITGEKMSLVEPHIYYTDKDNIHSMPDRTTFMHGSRVIAIIGFGIPIVKHQNVFYGDEQKILKENRLGSVWLDHRRLPLAHPAWNEVSDRLHASKTRGYFNGNLYDFVKNILSKKPNLQIPYRIEPELIVARYIRDGKPGYVSKYRRPYFLDEPFFRDLPYAKVNIKPFRKWVLKNYKHFIAPTKQLIEMRKLECLKIEKSEYDLDRYLEIYRSRHSDLRT